MTKEEAIMVLKNEQPHCGKKALFPEEKKYEAYDVAIKALEQEPCEDAISRQEVLDEMKIRRDNGDMITAGFIKGLPPVTPQPETVTEFADRCRECGAKYGKLLKQDSCEDAISRQEVLDILKDKWNMFSDANDAMQESIDTIEAVKSVTPLPQPFDLEGLKSDLKALNCGFPYGLDYLLDCLNRRLGITIIEADKAEGSDKE